jgi:DNA-binding NarL/FixJ family response regulator
MGRSGDVQDVAGLLERDYELLTVTRAAREATEGKGSALLITGPAGIGKTALVRAARMIADAAGLMTLTARGTELEGDFGFGAARQLLESAVLDAPEPDELLAGPARLAALLFDAELAEAVPAVPAVPPGPDAGFAMLNALYRLTSNLARRTPLALLVDDAHLSDAASLRFFSYLAGRLENLPVMLLLASRPSAEPGNGSVRSLDLELGSEGVLHLGPLTEDAAARLVRGTLPDATDELCRACRLASGGNPFLLRELTKMLLTSPQRDIAMVHELVPESVVAAVRSRIDRLPGSARELARAAAILGDGTLLRHAAAIAGLSQTDAAAAADVLGAAGILDGGRPLAFQHPLIRGAVHGELAAGERAAGHERAARLLADEGATLERVAAHLLGSDASGSAWTSDQLRAAARESIRRGVPETAVTYLRRAHQEPPPAQTRSELLMELGEAEALTLDPRPAAEHLMAGIAASRDQPRRLQAALLLAGMLGLDDRSDEGVEVLERALAEDQDADPALRNRIEAHLVNVARFDLRTRQRTAARAAEVRRRVLTGEAAGGIELTAAAAEEAMAGESALRTAELAERAIEQLQAEGTPVADYTVYSAARCLIISDRLDDARRVLDAALDQARERGAVVSAAGALAFRCDAHYRAGALAAAELDGVASFQSTRGGWRIGMPATAAILVSTLVELGRLDEASVTIEQAGLSGVAKHATPSYPMSMLLHARGRLRLARADAAGALEDLLEMGRRQDLMGEPNPSLSDWRSLAARALLLLGRRDEALALATGEVRLARRFAAPRALGMALRVAGEIEGGERGLAQLREAVAVLTGSPAVLVRAYALTDLGAVLRDQGAGVEARETLAVALDLAHTCGASLLASRVLQELHAAGARPRRAATSGAGALTPSERRVADLATTGLSNRDIADELFVTVRTVEFHLSGAFRKLGVRSRGELESVLAADESTVSD